VSPRHYECNEKVPAGGPQGREEREVVLKLNCFPDRLSKQQESLHRSTQNATMAKMRSDTRGS